MCETTDYRSQVALPVGHGKETGHDQPAP